MSCFTWDSEFEWVNSEQINVNKRTKNFSVPFRITKPELAAYDPNIKFNGNPAWNHTGQYYDTWKCLKGLRFVS